MKIAGTLNAYLTSEWAQKDFIQCRANNDEAGMVAELHLTSVEGMESEGWLKVGVATVTVDVVDDDTLRQNLINGLKEQKADILAKAQAQATRIEEKIQNLLAITHEPANKDDSSNIPF